MIVNDADRYACGVETRWGTLLEIICGLVFKQLLPLAGFLQIGVEVAPFIEVEFYDSTNPV